MKARLTLLLFLVLAVSCGRGVRKEDMIVGHWHLYSVKTNQSISNQEQYKTAMNQLIRTTSIQFNEDKSFGGTIWGDTSFGYWLIQGDSLIVKDLSNKIEFGVLITEITNHKLILQEVADSVIEILSFER